MSDRSATTLDAGSRLEQAYRSEKPRLLARVRAGGLQKGGYFPTIS